MNAELKQKWIEALRSGKYQQGRKVLRNTDGSMCCLGVLLDLVEPDGWSEFPIQTNGNALYRHKADNAFGDFPASNYRAACGLTDTAPDSDGMETIGHRLAALNDAGNSFAEIADWIEQNIPADAS